MIRLCGARTHNLKNISLDIPRNTLTIVTGLSGSGKSSLVFDTLHAEGQRRFVESLSAYARQFIPQLQKPDLDALEGISPTIAIEQRAVIRSSRSTVGTMTEIYDYLRLLYAKIGIPQCLACGEKISAISMTQVEGHLFSLYKGANMCILAPTVRRQKGAFREHFEHVVKKGFTKAIVDGVLRPIEPKMELSKNSYHSIDVVIDFLTIKEEQKIRLRDDLKIASELTKGVIKLGLLKGKASLTKSVEFEEEILFSDFMACPSCSKGFGEIEPRIFSFNSSRGACPTCHGIGEEEGKICRACGGTRLKKQTLSIFLAERNIAELLSLPIKNLFTFFLELKLKEREKIIADRILKEILSRLAFLEEVGLPYITLNRSSMTLSGGEIQRVRLATQLGSKLMGVVYVLDEPSIGLHYMDGKRLIGILKKLRDGGNTVIVVEHDEAVIRSADFIVDMGPLGGALGGYIVSTGNVQQISCTETSITGQYLTGKRKIHYPEQKKEKSKEQILLRGARTNNLKCVDFALPLGAFTCITGVSGSGKSSLVLDTLYPALQHKKWKSPLPPHCVYTSLEGDALVDKVIYVDQSPIGKTPRSNPSTYLHIFDFIRRLFASLPEAKVRGYRASHFSFNVKGGRCESCRGGGVLKIQMHFLPDIYVTCQQCQGKRYGQDTLEIRYRGRNIHEVLDLTIAEAKELFGNFSFVAERLGILMDLGLGYVKAGQPTVTLSGGESQRLKLAKELCKKATGNTLYLFDEPTTGLHFYDVEKLLMILKKLTLAGGTVVVIEHHPEVICSADYIIDLGPGGGEEGGKIIGEGRPDEMVQKNTPTGKMLKEKKEAISKG